VAVNLAQVAKRQLPDHPSVNDTLGCIYYKKGLASISVLLFEQAVARDAKDQIAIGIDRYALLADFATATIDVLKGTQGSPDLPSKFVDPILPAGYAPFNVQVLNGAVYVTYALRDPASGDDIPGGRPRLRGQVRSERELRSTPGERRRAGLTMGTGDRTDGIW
jgi:hypothetical protein